MPSKFFDKQTDSFHPPIDIQSTVSERSVMPTTTRVTFNNREVQNPALRVLLVTAAIIIAASPTIVAAAVTIIVPTMLVILSPVLYLVHRILVATGRRGFVSRSGKSLEIEVSAQGFRKLG